MSKTATSAPASASPWAKASPQPRAPPVTNATRPFNENYISLAGFVLVYSTGTIAHLGHDLGCDAIWCEVTRVSKAGIECSVSSGD